MPQSNDHFSLTPRTDFDGPVLEFDLPGLSVGIAEYGEGPTGTTVFVLDGGWQTAIDVRGGDSGLTGRYDMNHAIVLSGGSLMGLGAAAGVTEELFARGGHNVFTAQALVSGAIIWDYVERTGGNSIHPDSALGRAATIAAKAGQFPLGARGAGRSASVGKLWLAGGETAGQGAAFGEVGDAKVLVCVVLNALGAVIGRDGTVVRGNFDRETGRRLSPAEIASRVDIVPPLSGKRTQNTTLTVVATDAKLNRRQLTQLGRQVHTSMVRAIYPFHTTQDGDVLFTVTSNRTDATVPLEVLAMSASELAWDAVLSAAGE